MITHCCSAKAKHYTAITRPGLMVNGNYSGSAGRGLSRPLGTGHEPPRAAPNGCSSIESKLCIDVGQNGLLRELGRERERSCDLWLQGLAAEFRSFHLPTHQFGITGTARCCYQAFDGRVAQSTHGGCGLSSQNAGLAFLWLRQKAFPPH